ncbi:MAG: response regulator transcription factor [Chthonomonadaceae bacterium]|nr:response regulator transcription factor [Chthonomonadaceae bacterium]
MDTVRVLIVDDHSMVREGLRALLARSDKVSVVGEAVDGEDALAKIPNLGVDLVLLDWMMPKMDGLQVCQAMNKIHPDVRVVMLTNHLDDVAVKSAIQAGAIGYLLKDVSFEELEDAILDAATGKSVLHPEAQQSLMSALGPDIDPTKNLTAREKEVLKLIATGHSNKEIGVKLSLTEGTVKGYVSVILVKTGTADRTQAALLAVRMGLDK